MERMDARVNSIILSPDRVQGPRLAGGGLPAGGPMIAGGVVVGP